MPKTRPFSVFRKYIIDSDGKQECKFCQTILGKNITRSRDHFLYKCKSIPSTIKMSFKIDTIEGN
jgi:hypothetical protein